MVGVMNIVRHLLNQAEQVVDKTIVDHLQVIYSKPLHTRHLVHELQQEPMQTRILISTTIDQLQEAGEAGFAHHAGKHGLVLAAIEEEEAGDGVERSDLVLLEEAVDDLVADVFLVGLKQVAGEEHLGTGDDLILRLAEVVAEAGGQVYPGAQGIVDGFVAFAFARDAFSEFCKHIVSVRFTTGQVSRRQMRATIQTHQSKAVLHPREREELLRNLP